MVAAERRVNVTEQGRCGRVRYEEAAGALEGYWELGGGDAIAVVSMGSEDAWRRQHAWAVARRADILHFVATEVVRQRAPGCRAAIDEASGDIVVRRPAGAGTGAGVAAPRVGPDVSWFGRWRRLRLMLALGVLAAAVLLGGIAWLGRKVLTVDPGKGTPIGLAVRTGTHVATLIRTLEPYVPSLHRDHSKDRYAIGVFVVPLDGTAPSLVPVAGGLAPNEFALSKILGSDGRSLWFDVRRVGAIDLATFAVRTPGGAAPRDLVGAAATPLPEGPDALLSAGFLTGPQRWLGLHSTSEVERDYRPGQFVRRVVRQADGRAQRQFFVGTLDPESGEPYRRILVMEPLGGATYPNAAFLRMDGRSEPIRLGNPEGALMVFSSAAGPKATVTVARADTAGALLWTVDTGIDRFALRQILPGARSVAFVGPRPSVPDRVPEPLLVLVANDTGTLTTHSLWQ